MKIVVNHLTKMSPGYICVAGIDLETGRHVRPALGKRLETKLLACHGGPFDIASICNLGPVIPTPQRPEVEDCRFSPDRVKSLGTMDPNEFWQRLSRIASKNLIDIFGKDLKARGPKSCGVDVERGNASLGCLILEEIPKFHLRPGLAGHKQIRLAISDGTFNLDLGVNDIRFYRKDHSAPDEEVVSRAESALAEGDPFILSVGLTRPFAASGQKPLHWLQVNNIHFKSNII
ncbi:MAG: hypothetical protein HY747_09845 [Elusimicrobia bacterium]|nr:hypothetical protein [Elusimicrobiota bacterium]